VRYASFRFYSAELDAEAVRISVADERGAEYFAIVEAGSGKRWLERRDTALDAIQYAMQSGWPAGCVAVMPAT
jgi:hypothetical protein